MKRCFIYARVANRNREGLESQITNLTVYAREHHFQITGISMESTSGLTCKRNGLNEAMQAIKNRQADIVLVKDISRIGRNALEAMDWVRLVETHGAEVISCVDGKIDTECDKSIRLWLSDIAKYKNAAVCSSAER